MNFNNNIFDNRKKLLRPLIVAHRGSYSANIPCNTLESFIIAINQGADVIELDVSKSVDGEFFVFHPGKEEVFLHTSKRISEMTSGEVKNLRLVNQDGKTTSYRIPSLEEALLLLKNKVYINIDKFWTDIEGITKVIRKTGTEKQIIIKTGINKQYLAMIKKYAPDIMYMPIVKQDDDFTINLKKEGINVIGAEVLFETDSADVISDNFIEKMHSNNLMVWVNSIIYDEKEVIASNHTDDISLCKNPDFGWGWLADKNVDFIQTDWTIILKNYLTKK